MGIKEFRILRVTW